MTDIKTILIVLFVLVVIYTNIKTENNEDFTVSYKYVNGYPHQRNYQRSWWFNNFTPFVWGNPTRIPSWYYPPYAYIQQYYYDYFW